MTRKSWAVAWLFLISQTHEENDNHNDSITQSSKLEIEVAIMIDFIVSSDAHCEALDRCPPWNICRPLSTIVFLAFVCQLVGIEAFSSCAVTNFLLIGFKEGSNGNQFLI